LFDVLSADVAANRRSAGHANEATSAVVARGNRHTNPPCATNTQAAGQIAFSQNGCAGSKSISEQI
jgi:hypothetical protein